MRVILSRKGWDSSAGGRASPVFPKGAFASLPIPIKAGREFPQVRHAPVEDLQLVVQDLGGHAAGQRFHFDPDIYKHWWPRDHDWRPAFGQDGAAQTHLARCGVGVGDLFLFFGWFRQVTSAGGCWRYVCDAPDVHMLYGWLQVGDVINLPNSRAGALTAVEAAGFAGLAEHPHVEFAHAMSPANCLYVAADEATLNGTALGVPGGGAFKKSHPDLRLTEPGMPRSNWLLPTWCMPGGALTHPMSYHGNLTRWSKRHDGRTRVRTVSRGQEFVLDIGTHASALKWLRDLLTRHGHQEQ